MAANRFDNSYDPAFDLRTAEVSRGTTQPDDHPGSIEHAGGDLLSATEDGLLAVAAPALAPVVAAVAAGEAVLDAGKDAYNAASDVTDVIGDLLGGSDEHPGQSTFPDDPNAPKLTPEEYAAEREAALEARRAEVREHERLQAVHDGAKDGNVDDAHGDHFSVFQDEHHALVGNLDDHVAAGVSTGSGLLDVQTTLVGSGALGALGAPDDVLVPVSELRDHVALGADQSSDLQSGLVGPGASGALGAPDDVLVPVSELRDHVALGADPSVQADRLPTADHVPADVPLGADVQLNPQPIPPGIGANIGESAADAALHQAPSGGDSSIIIVGGAGSPVASHDIHTSHVSAGPTFGADVQLNPQPIPPGIGADIGEPAADAAVHQAPSGGDSSIIIVGGAGSPLASHEVLTSHVSAADAPEEHDVASTFAPHAEDSTFHVADLHDAPVDVGLTEDELDS